MSERAKVSRENLAAVEERMLQALFARPSGLDEYGLIQVLREAGCEVIPTGSLIDPLNLFQAHFVIYHTLYKLRERLWRERRGHLQFGPLEIVLRSYHEGSAGLAEHDPMRAYYADPSHLETVTAGEVKELLGKFWSRFHVNEQRQGALAVLELEDPVDYAEIKRRYRRLAMRHHPDRGGDRERLQAINAAMETLAAYYR